MAAEVAVGRLSFVWLILTVIGVTVTIRRP